MFHIMVLDLKFLPLIRIVRPQLCQHPYFSLMAGHQASPPGHYETTFYAGMGYREICIDWADAHLRETSEKHHMTPGSSAKEEILLIQDNLDGQVHVVKLE